MQDMTIENNSELLKKKRAVRRWIMRGVYLLVLGLVAVYLIFPYLYMVMRSLMVLDDAVSTNPVYFSRKQG